MNIFLIKFLKRIDLLIFEISAALDQTNRTFKNLTIYFFVVCHQDVIRYVENGRQYLWYDKVVCELDNIFCEKKKISLVSVKLF